MILQGQFGFRNLPRFDARVSKSIQKRDGWVDSIHLKFKKAFDVVVQRGYEQIKLRVRGHNMKIDTPPKKRGDKYVQN